MARCHSRSLPLGLRSFGRPGHERYNEAVFRSRRFSGRFLFLSCIAIRRRSQRCKLAPRHWSWTSSVRTDRPCRVAVLSTPAISPAISLLQIEIVSKHLPDLVDQWLPSNTLQRVVYRTQSTRFPLFKFASASHVFFTVLNPSLNRWLWNSELPLEC